MARSATTLDSFSAIAEPRRRRVMEVLAGGESPVGELVKSLKWAQPVVSKHLGVLKKVGLVNVRKVGRQRMYRVNGSQLKAVHEWTGMFERFWTEHVDMIKWRAERKARGLES